MTQYLLALLALPEDLESSPRTNMTAHTVSTFIRCTDMHTSKSSIDTQIQAFKKTLGTVNTVMESDPGFTKFLSDVTLGKDPVLSL